jgi:ATP-dependent DNA ligase
MPAPRLGLVFFILDLLHLDGEDVSARLLIERKARLAALLWGVPPPGRSGSPPHRATPPG